MKGYALYTSFGVWHSLKLHHDILEFKPSNSYTAAKGFFLSETAWAD